MAYVTYENKNNPHVTIHRDDCAQIAKHGGTHKYGQGHYERHTTYQEAQAYAKRTGLLIGRVLILPSIGRSLAGRWLSEAAARAQT